MKYTYIILFTFFSSLLVGQQEMTLERALAIGLENNFGIKIADRAIQIAENNNTWARAGRTPTVDLNGTLSNNFVNDNNPASFLQGTYYNGSLGATANANWVLYNGGRIALNKEQLNLAVNQEQLNKSADINALFRTIYQQYYEVIFQQEQLAVLNQVLALSQDRLAYETTKKEFGASNAYNLLQFENSVLADTNAIINQEQKVEVAKRNLNNTLDLEGYEPYIYTDRLSINPEDIDSDKLKKSLAEDNYTLKSLQMIAALNQLNTGIVNAATRPTISVSGAVGFAKNGFKFFADDPNTGDPFPFLPSTRFTGNIGANVSWNLYDGGVRRDNIQSAKMQEDIDQMTILQAKAELNNQLDILIDNYTNQIELLKLTDRQIQVSQRNLDITEERFKAGQLTSLDYRNVQNQYLNAAYSKVGAIYSLLVTKSEIDFLVGVFGE